MVVYVPRKVALLCAYIVWGISLPQSSGQRTLCPPIIATRKLDDFFLRFVADAQSAQLKLRTLYRLLEGLQSL